MTSNTTSTGSKSRKSTWRAQPTRRGRRPWHLWKLFAWGPGGLGFGLWLDTTGPHREEPESQPMMLEPGTINGDLLLFYLRVTKLLLPSDHRRWSYDHW